MNPVIKLTITICAVTVSSFLCHSERYRYLDNVKLDHNGMFLTQADSTSASISLEARAALDKNDDCHGKSKASWALIWNCISVDNYYYASIQCGNTDYGDFADKRYAEITVGHHMSDNDSIISRQRIYKGVDFYRGYNSLLMEWEAGKARIFVGNKELQHIFSLPMPSVDKGKCGILSNDNLTISSLVIETEPDKKLPLKTSWTIDSLNNHFRNSSDPMEGYWNYLDRENDERQAKLGGRYTIAIVKDNDGYLLLYANGAEINRDNWHECMIKGRLISTIFTDHYDLVWIDAMMTPVSKDIHADVIDKVIISFEFPLYKTRLRFSKSPTLP